MVGRNRQEYPPINLLQIFTPLGHVKHQPVVRIALENQGKLLKMNGFFILRNKQDLMLLGIVLLSLAYIVIYRSELPIIPALDCSPVQWLFNKSESGSAIEAVAASIVAGYIVYIFVEVLPHLKNVKDDVRLLNNLAASIKVAFYSGNPFSHERAISFLKDDNVKTEEELEKVKNDVYRCNTNHLKLKFAMETAHSQMLAFSHALVVATKISPECALRWIDLTSAAARLGLLYEQYCTLPDIWEDEIYTVSSQAPGNPREEIHSEMSDRFYQYNETVLYWKKSLPKYVS